MQFPTIYIKNSIKFAINFNPYFMDNELFVLLVGAAVAGIVQGGKKLFGDKVNPLLLVAVVSLVLGGVYYLAVLNGVFTSELHMTIAGIFASAVAVYEILKSYLKSKE